MTLTRKICRITQILNFNQRRFETIRHYSNFRYLTFTQSTHYNIKARKDIVNRFNAYRINNNFLYHKRGLINCNLQNQDNFMMADSSTDDNDKGYEKHREVIADIIVDDISSTTDSNLGKGDMTSDLNRGDATDTVTTDVSSSRKRRLSGNETSCDGISVDDATDVVAATASSPTRGTGDVTSTGKRRLVLGIETSCDDTGAAVVDDQRNILGEALFNQTKTHVQMGGIIPPIARDLHQEHIEHVVQDALDNAKVTLEDLDAIAVTVKPGLALSLIVGLEHAKKLVKLSGKPMIPIHHMEAHALTVRLTNDVEYPFMVLLVSGGNCLLCVVRGVDDFLLLGYGLDDAPGDAYDKTARRMKLKNLPECEGMCGGAAIEMMARNGDQRAFEFPSVMTKYADCNFSFAGIKFHAHKIVGDEEKRQGLEPSAVLPNISDVCASFQYGVLKHLARRVQRALSYCDLKGLLPNKKTLVISGGVGSNLYLRSGLQSVCTPYNCEIVCPPPRLCTDNGVMIAWNGMERLLAKCPFADDPQSVDFHPKCALGVNITEEVTKCSIKLPKLKLFNT